MTFFFLLASISLHKRETASHPCSGSHCQNLRVSSFWRLLLIITLWHFCILLCSSFLLNQGIESTVQRTVLGMCWDVLSLLAEATAFAQLWKSELHWHGISFLCAIFPGLLWCYTHPWSFPCFWLGLQCFFTRLTLLCLQGPIFVWWLLSFHWFISMQMEDACSSICYFASMESGVFPISIPQYALDFRRWIPRVSICMAGLIADVYSSLDV